MTRLIISGCNGKMGRMLTSVISNRCDCEIVAGFDINTESTGRYPVYANPMNCDLQADAIIDFSHPAALQGVLDYALSHQLPVVVATTGLNEEQLQQVKNASHMIPVFFSANMSLGISLLAELAKKAAAILGGEFDVEIVEKHHNQKIDAPSGTALLLADALSPALPYEPVYTFDRHAVRQKREQKEIGFSSIRGGTIVGEHDIIFAGRDEVITLSHSAASKEVFAVGAVNAALFLVGKEPGYYSMSHLVSDL